MQAVRTVHAGGPDLADIAGFWTRPLDERTRAFTALRADRPIAFFDEPEGFPTARPGFFAVTRHEHVAEASRRPDVFTSGAGTTGIVDLPPEFMELAGSIINMDDPRHARMRRIVSRGFTPRRLAHLQGAIEATAADAVSRVIEAGRSNGGRCEVVADLAGRLPLQTICTMMGIPESQYRMVFECSNVLTGPQDPDYVPEVRDPVSAMAAAAGDLAALVTELGVLRLAEPADDLVSVLVNAEIDGERLTFDELASFFILLIAAGIETTRSAISWGVHALSQHPEQRAAWAADVDGLARTAVEEILRWSSPVIFMRRTVAIPYELAGTPLEPGDKVALFYWSANRDEARFTNPETFDIRRDPNPHIAFGGQGPHHCLGAYLARREIGALFGELLRRIPDLDATAEPQRLTSMFLNGVKRLPAAFTPG